LRSKAFLNDAIRVVSTRADDKRLNLVADITPSVRMRADHRLLKQIVLNLLSQFGQVHAGGRPRRHPRAGVRQRGHHRHRGTGIGIPKDALAKLGRPFEQVESQLTKSHQGSGLGLAIAKSLTELHGGTMRIRSQLGRGTIVLLRLPIEGTAIEIDVAEALNAAMPPCRGNLRGPDAVQELNQFLAQGLRAAG